MTDSNTRCKEEENINKNEEEENINKNEEEESIRKKKEEEKIKRKKMIQSSLLCAPKGSVIFLMGAFRLLDGLLTAKGDKEKAEKKTKEGLYAMYNNLIPLLEVLILMPAIMKVIKLITGSNPLIHDTFGKIAAVFVCMLCMISVCLSLRVAQIRRDCCADFNFKDHMQGKDDLFEIPKSPNLRNSLPIINFDTLSKKLQSLSKKLQSLSKRLQSLIGNNPDQISGDKNKDFSIAMDILFKLIQWPFHIVLLSMNVIELPFRLIVDLIGCIKDQSFEKKEFEETLKFIKQDLTFNFYKSIEPLSKILPNKYEEKVKNYFKDVIIDANGVQLGTT